MTCREVQVEIQKKIAEGEYRSNFSGKNIWLKYKVFDAIFYADSEYHVYFALESTFNGQNVKNSEKLWYKSIFDEGCFPNRTRGENKIVHVVEQVLLYGTAYANFLMNSDFLIVFFQHSSSLSQQENHAKVLQNVFDSYEFWCSLSWGI